MDNILDALWDKDLSFSVHEKIYFIGIVVTMFENFTLCTKIIFAVPFITFLWHLHYHNTNQLKSFIPSKQLDEWYYIFLPIVTRNNIVWKLPRDYYLRYCNNFSLVPDPAEYMFFCNRKVQYFFRLTRKEMIL